MPADDAMSVAPATLPSNEEQMKARNPMVIHYVHDMDRAKRFYMEVFEVKPSFESPGWTTLDFGAIQLALHSLPAGDDGPLPHAGLILEVDRIEEIQERIEKHGGRMKQLIEPRHNVPVRIAICEDSEGNGFELGQKP
jgi:predicted enzyme related to lactoylglutathione lyase